LLTVVDSDLFLWKDVTVSAIAFGFVQFYYFFFANAPFMSIVALFIIVISVAPPVIIHLNKRFDFGLVDLETLSPPPELTKQNTKEAVKTILSILNSAIRMFSSVLSCEYLEDNKQLAIIGIVLFFFGLSFRTSTIIYIISCLLFVIPVAFANRTSISKALKLE
jgi:hypothetical protein